MAHISLLEAGPVIIIIIIIVIIIIIHHEDWSLSFKMIMINLMRIFQECSFQIGSRRPQRAKETELVKEKNIFSNLKYL